MPSRQSVAVPVALATLDTPTMQALRERANDFTAVGVTSIQTQAEFDTLTARIATARDLADEADRYFGVLMNPARETVRRITAALRAFTDPLRRFNDDGTRIANDWLRRERIRRTEEARLAQELEAASYRIAAEEPGLTEDEVDALAIVAQETAQAPVSVARVEANDAVTTATRTALEIVDVSAFCRWIADHDNPHIAMQFADAATTVARRVLREYGVLPAGCQMVESDVIRRRASR